MSHQIEGSGKGKEVIVGNGSGGDGGDDGCSRGGHGKKSNRPPGGLVCPRCQSRNSKFCYYNNGSIYQPRYYCSDCRRYWTEGGIQRNIPVGGPNRRQRRSASDSSPASVIVLALPPWTLEQQRQLLAAVSATATGASSVTAMHQRLFSQPTLNAFPRAGFGTNLGLVMNNSFNLPALQTTQRPPVNRPLLRPYLYPYPGVQQQQQQPINWALHQAEQPNPGVQQQEAQEEDMSNNNNNPIGDGSVSSYAFVDDWLDISTFMSSDNTTNDNNDLGGKEG